MAVNASALVDVRFFGDHDRAWISSRDCFLFSQQDPNPPTYLKRNNILDCLKVIVYFYLFFFKYYFLR